jgi:hypothetical protein
MELVIVSLMARRSKAEVNVSRLSLRLASLFGFVHFANSSSGLRRLPVQIARALPRRGREKRNDLSIVSARGDVTPKMLQFIPILENHKKAVPGDSFFWRVAYISSELQVHHTKRKHKLPHN